MARKILKTQEKKKKEKKEKKEKKLNSTKGTVEAIENHNYYILARSLWIVADGFIKEFKLKNQLKKYGEVEKLHHDVLLEDIWKWPDIMTRLFNIVENQAREYNEIQKKAIADVLICVTTVKAAEKYSSDIRRKYGDVAKSEYKEITKSIYFLIDLIAWFTLMRIQLNKNDLIFLNKEEKRRIKYLVTRFENTIKKTAIEIFEQNLAV